ncbi:MAG: Stk1 family PASTA domain-containing Ser/Thr kinase [Oscillospiraceae bacterium]|nr:Stk1 family PASTA domain-containing Ser/Thr kinase [Oscillospiraceae bacterium]
MDYEQTDIFPGMILEDRYELLEQIGSGGMAVVYRAMDTRLNRYVAVKIMRRELASNEKFRHRFQTESQAIAMLSHPNIVNVFDVSHSDSIEYIVMELINGETLKQYLRRQGRLGTRQMLNYSIQIAKALSHAHGKGVIHRDIKPQNILVVEDGTVKVADFGIADLQSEVPDVENEAIGSVHYISPEQARGLPVDARSDIYSLGIVMYEMLSGKLPFDGDDDRAIALKHLSAIPTPLREIDPKIPKDLEAIVMKAMAPYLEDRYQTADALIADLEKFRKTVIGAFEAPDGNVVPVSSTGEMSRESYVRRRRRAGRVSMLSGIFGVLAFILILAVFLWNYWLRDIFTVNERITIPNFVGSNYETIINSKNFKSSFNFNLTYEIDPEVEKGVIIGQSPEAGKSYMLTEDGINVDLTISTGVMLVQIPESLSGDYREVTSELEKLGFNVEKLYVSSNDVALDSVIDISPAPGERLPAGATVYVTISLGPDEETVIMPYLVGDTQQNAEAQIEALRLTLVSVSAVYNKNVPAGCVVSQNVDAGTEIPVQSKIYLQISLGPEFTPTPEPTAAPAPTEEPAYQPEVVG